MRHLLTLLISLSFIGCTCVTSNQMPPMERVGSTNWIERGIKLSDGTQGYFYLPSEKNYIKSELYRLGYSANECVDIVNNYNKDNTPAWWEFWR